MNQKHSLEILTSRYKFNYPADYYVVHLTEDQQILQNKKFFGARKDTSPTLGVSYSLMQVVTSGMNLETWVKGMSGVYDTGVLDQGKSCGKFIQDAIAAITKEQEKALYGGVSNGYGDKRECFYYNVEDVKQSTLPVLRTIEGAIDNRSQKIQFVSYNSSGMKTLHTVITFSGSVVDVFAEIGSDSTSYSAYNQILHSFKQVLFSSGSRPLIY